MPEYYVKLGQAGINSTYFPTNTTIGRLEFVLALNYTLICENIKGSGGTPPHILNLGTVRW
jgi:hypothetical protein